MILSSHLSRSGLALLLLVACADEEAPALVHRGVADVRVACEARARWTRATSPDCLGCRSGALLPVCACELVREFSGACEAQANAQRAEPSCTTAIGDCERGCSPDDCACLDACLGQADACRQVTAARDGCVTEVCAPYCE